jgi:hypothetical protein
MLQQIGEGVSEEMISRGTRDRYHIRCKIIRKKFSYRETQSRGKRWNETANSIILVPEDSDEANAFFNAWLPLKLTEEEIQKINGQKPWAEIIMEAGAPISAYFRGALCNGNQILDRPHIFVMTKKAEEKLDLYLGKGAKAKKYMDLTILGEQEEEILYGDLKVETKSPYADIT